LTDAWGWPSGYPQAEFSRQDLSRLSRTASHGIETPSPTNRNRLAPMPEHVARSSQYSTSLDIATLGGLVALHRGSFTVFLALSVSLRTESLGHGGTPRAVCLHCSTFLSYPASGSRGRRHPPCALVEAGRRWIDGEGADTHTQP